MGFIGSPKHWVDFCPPFGHPRHLKSEEYPPGAAMTLTNDPSTRFTVYGVIAAKSCLHLLRCVTNQDCRLAGKRGKHCCEML